MPPKVAKTRARVAVTGGQKKRRGRRRNYKTCDPFLSPYWTEIPPPLPSPPWTELPPEITANILHRFGAVKILETAQGVCSSWLRLSKDPSMWRVIDMRYKGERPYDIEDKCRKAVDRSQGQLLEIYLQSTVDDTLDYIAERAGNLKKLQLENCYCLSGKRLIEAVKRFPNLEEMHIILSDFTDETIEMLGRSCPLLRSFTFNGQATKFTAYDYENDCMVTDITMPKLHNEDAFAIARSMPGLRHLQVMVNGMTNEGLKAILDGCPLLESLDLRRCFHLRLTDDLDLEKRLSAQIPCLRYPNDSIADYGFKVNDDYFDWSPYCGPTWSDYEYD